MNSTLENRESKSAHRPVINIVSMGCSKNLVDSERLMKQLEDVGFEVLFEELPNSRKRIDYTIINTCGFIGDAKEESINAILSWGERRTRKKLRGLYVMGCLSERYRSELPDSIPEVDGWYGKFDWETLAKDISNQNPGILRYDRKLTTPRHYCYLKISEGCNRFCAFCAIPLITGRHKSRPIAEIEDEVRLLVSRGVKEFNIIAQDLSAYGTDLEGGKSRLAELIDTIAAIPGVEWIRLHYAYPADFPMDLLDVMARHKNVCRYLDIALQHGSDKILSAMRRHIDMESTRKLLSEIRKRVPGIHIRTTMMTGFPSEGEEEFEQMYDFVNEQRFERMGAFAYCEEEGTYAARNYGDPIEEEVKQERLKKLMELQESISFEHNRKKIGKTFRVIVDRKNNDKYVGRTEFDSPEVDPEVIIDDPGFKLKPGDFVNVEIYDALPFDLMGRVVSQETV